MGPEKVFSMLGGAVKFASKFKSGGKGGSSGPDVGASKTKMEHVSCYPTDILSANSEVTKAIKFSAYKYSYNAKAGNAADEQQKNYTGTHQWCCFLPITKISTSDDHTYDPFEGFGASQAVNAGVQGYNDYKAGADKSKLAGDALNTVVPLAAKGVYNTLKNTMGDELSVFRRNLLGGKAINPMTSKIYSSSTLKRYSFNFDFVARNANETAVIDEIVKNFMRYSRPSNAHADVTAETNAFLKSNLDGLGLPANTNITLDYFEHPSLWRIEFIDDTNENKIAKYLPKIKTCVLSGVTVDFGGQDNPTFFRETSAPVMYSVQLQFEELFMQTSSDV